ncbi:MAG: hypothetical protein WAN59_09590 [Candidatus Baltobacteraceae bacterium]
MKRQLAARTWSKPLASSATRPRHFFWMDRRWFVLCAFCGVPTAFAPDFRWQVVFAAAGVLLGVVGIFAWRHNPYLIDELQAELALPHGGPADAYEDA